jgi:hypothetical protein
MSNIYELKAIKYKYKYFKLKQELEGGVVQEQDERRALNTYLEANERSRQNAEAAHYSRARALNTINNTQQQLSNAVASGSSAQPVSGLQKLFEALTQQVYGSSANIKEELLEPVKQKLLIAKLALIRAKSAQEEAAHEQRTGGQLILAETTANQALAIANETIVQAQIAFKNAHLQAKAQTQKTLYGDVYTQAHKEHEHPDGSGIFNTRTTFRF